MKFEPRLLLNPKSRAVFGDEILKFYHAKSSSIDLRAQLKNKIDKMHQRVKRAKFKLLAKF